MKLTVFDYEELYKQSLEKARDYHDDPNCLESLKDILEDIFPSLKESEDEKIRKALIQFHQSTIDIDGIKGEKIIDWLEKQGKPFDDNIITRDDEILQAISIGLTDAEKDLGWSDFGGLPIEEIQDWLEKQGKNRTMEEQQ